MVRHPVMRWVMVMASTLILLAGFIIPVETSDEESRQKS
jgi:hypothetical protein